jgi:hypothetical protein
VASNSSAPRFEGVPYRSRWRAQIQRIKRLLARAEFKRRQAPPILRLRARAFGSGRQMPIAAHYGDS